MSEQPVRAEARVVTGEASKYLQQLCKHFQHKLTVEYDPTAGEIRFSSGVAKLAADAEALTIAVEAQSAEDLESLKDVVARHLVRFAFREALDLPWRTAR